MEGCVSGEQSRAWTVMVRAYRVLGLRALANRNRRLRVPLGREQDALFE